MLVILVAGIGSVTHKATRILTAISFGLTVTQIAKTALTTHLLATKVLSVAVLENPCAQKAMLLSQLNQHARHQHRGRNASGFVFGPSHVPWIVAVSNVATFIGAGLTGRYFNLWWINEMHFSGADISFVQTVTARLLDMICTP